MKPAEFSKKVQDLVSITYSGMNGNVLAGELTEAFEALHSLLYARFPTLVDEEGEFEPKEITDKLLASWKESGLRCWKRRVTMPATSEGFMSLVHEVESLRKERDDLKSRGQKEWDAKMKALATTEELEEERDKSKCALKSSEEHVEYMRTRLALVDALALVADKILEHKDSGSDVDYHLEAELVELERALDAYRAGEAKPILPEDIMEKYLAEARKSTMFGHPLDDLSREELMATIGLLGWDLQGERTSHMNSIEMFRLLGGR